MSWNNKAMRLAFEREEAKTMELCRQNGMSEEAIRELYELDLEIFNSDRRFYEHSQSLEVKTADMDSEEQNPLMNKFLDAVSVEQKPSEDRALWWMDEISDPKLFRALKRLGEEKLLILHYTIYEGYSIRKAAEILGMPASTLQHQKRAAIESLRAAMSP